MLWASTLAQVLSAFVVNAAVTDRLDGSSFFGYDDVAALFPGPRSNFDADSVYPISRQQTFSEHLSTPGESLDFHRPVKYYTQKPEFPKNRGFNVNRKYVEISRHRDDSNNRNNPSNHNRWRKIHSTEQAPPKLANSREESQSFNRHRQAIVNRIEDTRKPINEKSTSKSEESFHTDRPIRDELWKFLEAHPKSNQERTNLHSKEQSSPDVGKSINEQRRHYNSHRQDSPPNYDSRTTTRSDETFLTDRDPPEIPVRPTYRQLNPTDPPISQEGINSRSIDTFLTDREESQKFRKKEHFRRPPTNQEKTISRSGETFLTEKEESLNVRSREKSEYPPTVHERARSHSEDTFLNDRQESHTSRPREYLRPPLTSQERAITRSEDTFLTEKEESPDVRSREHFRRPSTSQERSSSLSEEELRSEKVESQNIRPKEYLRRPSTSQERSTPHSEEMYHSEKHKAQNIRSRENFRRPPASQEISSSRSEEDLRERGKSQRFQPRGTFRHQHTSEERPNSGLKEDALRNKEESRKEESKNFRAEENFRRSSMTQDKTKSQSEDRHNFLPSENLRRPTMSQERIRSRSEEETFLTDREELPNLRNGNFRHPTSSENSPRKTELMKSQEDEKYKKVTSLEENIRRDDRREDQSTNPGELSPRTADTFLTDSEDYIYFRDEDKFFPTEKPKTHNEKKTTSPPSEAPFLTDKDEFSNVFPKPHHVNSFKSPSKSQESFSTRSEESFLTDEKKFPKHKHRIVKLRDSRMKKFGGSEETYFREKQSRPQNRGGFRLSSTANPTSEENSVADNFLTDNDSNPLSVQEEEEDSTPHPKNLNRGRHVPKSRKDSHESKEVPLPVLRPLFYEDTMAIRPPTNRPSSESKDENKNQDQKTVKVENSEVSRKGDGASDIKEKSHPASESEEDSSVHSSNENSNDEEDIDFTEVDESKEDSPPETSAESEEDAPLFSDHFDNSDEVPAEHSPENVEDSDESPPEYNHDSSKGPPTLHGSEEDANDDSHELDESSPGKVDPDEPLPEDHSSGEAEPSDSEESPPEDENESVEFEPEEAHDSDEATPVAGHDPEGHPPEENTGSEELPPIIGTDSEEHPPDDEEESEEHPPEGGDDSVDHPPEEVGESEESPPVDGADSEEPPPEGDDELEEHPPEPEESSETDDTNPDEAPLIESHEGDSSSEDHGSEEHPPPESEELSPENGDATLPDNNNVESEEENPDLNEFSLEELFPSEEENNSEQEHFGNKIRKPGHLGENTIKQGKPSTEFQNTPFKPNGENAQGYTESPKQKPDFEDNKLHPSADYDEKPKPPSQGNGENEDFSPEFNFNDSFEFDLDILDPPPSSEMDSPSTTPKPKTTVRPTSLPADCADGDDTTPHPIDLLKAKRPIKTVKPERRPGDEVSIAVTGPKAVRVRTTKGTTTTTARPFSISALGVMKPGGEIVSKVVQPTTTAKPQEEVGGGRRSTTPRMPAWKAALAAREATALTYLKPPPLGVPHTWLLNTQPPSPMFRLFVV